MNVVDEEGGNIARAFYRSKEKITADARARGRPLFWLRACRIVLVNFEGGRDRACQKMDVYRLFTYSIVCEIWVIVFNQLYRLVAGRPAPTYTHRCTYLHGTCRLPRELESLNDDIGNTTSLLDISLNLSLSVCFCLSLTHNDAAPLKHKRTTRALRSYNSPVFPSYLVMQWRESKSCEGVREGGVGDGERKSELVINKHGVHVAFFSFTCTDFNRSTCTFTRLVLDIGVN